MTTRPNQAPAVLRDVRKWASTLALAALSLSGSSCDPSDVIQVTSTEDGGPGSLRAAIQQANQATGHGVRIEIPTGTYVLTRCGADDDNANGDLDVTTAVPVELVATSPDVTIRQSCAGERVLDGRGAGTLSVTGVTITGGSTAENGGGIRAGTLSLSGVTVTDNKARSGAGVYAAALAADAATITNNHADAMGSGGGALITGQAVVRRSTVSDNSAGRGGGIHAQASLTLSDTRVMRNAVARRQLVATYIVPATTSGGGVLADSLEADRVTIANNTVSSCGNLLSGYHLFSYGAAVSARTMKLVNTTISGNGLSGCNFGGFPGNGLILHATESVHLDHASLLGGQPGIGASSILTPAFTTHRSFAAAYQLCDATTVLRASSYNWFTDDTCALSGEGDRQDASLEQFLLTPLQDNGGAVPTLAPALNSALMDKIPARACPVKVDARGVRRPQGAECDIGAVETAYPPGVGAADLSLAWTAPSSFLAGDPVTFTLSIRNNGPQTSMPRVTLRRIHDFSVIEAATATHGGTCQGTYEVACQLGTLPAGDTATIRISANLFAYTPQIGFEARASAPALRPPYDDDQATATSAVRVDATVKPVIESYGRFVTLNAFNLGPGAAVTGDTEGFWFQFHPAPGVTVVDTTFDRSDPVFLPSSEPGISYTHTLRFDGIPPAQIGTVTVDPGVNKVSGPLSIPVYFTPNPDVAIKAYRQAGSFAPGAPVPITVEVSNVGQAPAQDTVVELNTECCAPGAPVVTWSSPASGSLQTAGAITTWRIPALAVGATVQLSGTAVGDGDQLSARVVSAPKDQTADNHEVLLSIGASPAGSADLQITSVETRPSGTWGYAARVTVTNLGPSAYEDPNQPAYLHATTRPSSILFNMTSASLTPSWTCNGSYCTTTTPMDSGASAVLEFTLWEVPDALWFNLLTGHQVPDPDPSNNVYWVERDY